MFFFRSLVQISRTAVIQLSPWAHTCLVWELPHKLQPKIHDVFGSFPAVRTIQSQSTFSLHSNYAGVHLEPDLFRCSQTSCLGQCEKRCCVLTCSNNPHQGWKTCHSSRQTRKHCKTVNTAYVKAPLSCMLDPSAWKLQNPWKGSRQKVIQPSLTAFVIHRKQAHPAFQAGPQTFTSCFQHFYHENANINSLHWRWNELQEVVH